MILDGHCFCFCIVNVAQWLSYWLFCHWYFVDINIWFEAVTVLIRAYNGGPNLHVGFHMCMFPYIISEYMYTRKFYVIFELLLIVGVHSRKLLSFSYLDIAKILC